MKQLTETLATTLDAAARNASAIEQISLHHHISLDDGYKIQAASLSKRYTRGEKLTGIKLGFTSKAKMEQMGVHDMIWGRLTDAMEIQPNQELKRNRFIHPRAEPEIAYLLRHTIEHPINIADVSDLLEGVAPAIEIIDSRYKNFKFSLEDVVADNCSSAAYVLGKWESPHRDTADINIKFLLNGQLVESGNSNAILGNPLQSVVEAARLAHQYGEVLKAGMIILAGAATPAVVMDSGDHVEAQFENFGNISFHVE